MADIKTIKIRIEGVPPKYKDGQTTGTPNVRVDAGDVFEIYLPVGVEDGEQTYRLADKEPKHA